MKTNMDLNPQGFEMLSNNEMLIVDGGKVSEFLAVLGGTLLVTAGFIITVAGAGTLNVPAAVAGGGAIGAGLKLIDSGTAAYRK